jgi:acyl-CoA thioesterase
MPDYPMTPRDIYDKMMENDAFSKWLGAEMFEISEGKCVMKMTVRAEMLNGFKISHGAITYALSDSTLAFAANSRGQKAVSIETSISHLRPVQLGDNLLSVAEEISRSKSVGVYTVKVFNQEEQLVSYFKGTVKISRDFWAVV